MKKNPFMKETKMTESEEAFITPFTRLLSQGNAEVTSTTSHRGGGGGGGARLWFTVFLLTFLGFADGYILCMLLKGSGGGSSLQG